MNSKIISPFEDSTVVIGTEKSERYTNSLKNELKGAQTEEDVRSATIIFLRDLTREVGVNVKIQNEKVVLSGGRIDSLFDNIIFEFKKPSYFDTPHGITEAIEGRNGVGGLVDYMISISCNESTSIEDFKKYLATKVGIGFDGKSFIFVRYVINVNNEIDLGRFQSKLSQFNWFPKSIDGYFESTKKTDIKSGLRFLFLYLRSISPRAPLTPESVSQRFGENSNHFRKHLKVLYSLLTTKLQAKDPHTATLYGEWDRVFGRVYGDINTATSDIKIAMNERYKESGFLNEAIDLKYLIFSIHTYYNIILKLLISNLFSSLVNPFSTQKAILTLGDEKFKNEIIRVVQGESFKLLNVENFFESGFFEWWTYAYTSEFSEMLREVIVLLEELEVTTSITKPELIGDMVKHTYHELMPQDLRHLLGEYFTPDWLAEYAIETSGFTGNLNETLLDPACGSGTFLSIALRKKMLKNSSTDRKTVIKDILQSIVGFDLNPISVIASKTNYLLALGDFTELDFPIKIPVYQCDSILTPAVHAVQKKKSEMFTIETFCGKFNVPALGTREAIEGLLDDIGTGIKNEYNHSQLLEKVRQNYKDINEEATLELFDKIKDLTKNEEDGLWIPILKNSFAPVYSESQFDYVIGNPPWVSWKSMSKSYRDLTLPIWLSYDIFDKSAYDKITTHDDFAMAFTYVSADHYLKQNGKLCFVISQTFFKSKKGGEGFRKFEITRSDSKVPIKAKVVIDMVAVKPFSEVTNRTSVLLLEKGNKTTYPAPYMVWTPKEKIYEHDTLTQVKRKINEVNLQAIPIAGTSDEKSLRSPWLTLPAGELEKARKAIGLSAYRGRKGIEPSGAKGVYLLKTPRYIGKTKVQITNLLKRGRLKEVEELGEHPGLIEDTFVFPLISGRDIAKYGLVSCSYVLMPHHNKKGVHSAVPEDELKVKYTATYEWLSYFKKVLLETRQRNSKFYDAKLDPFYCLDNVGIYTFDPWKVVWREQNRQMVSCVVSTKRDEPLKGKLIIPDSKVLFCPLKDEKEAHYLCAILNSKIVTDIIEGYTLELQRGTDILENIKIPKFDSTNKLHTKLRSLSMRAHKVFTDNGQLSQIEKEINNLVPRIFD